MTGLWIANVMHYFIHPRLFPRVYECLKERGAQTSNFSSSDVISSGNVICPNPGHHKELCEKKKGWRERAGMELLYVFISHKILTSNSLRNEALDALSCILLLNAICTTCCTVPPSVFNFTFTY